MTSSTMTSTSRDLSVTENKGQWWSSKMGLATKESGLWARKFVKAEVSKCGPMVLCMKATGRTTKQTAKED